MPSVPGRSIYRKEALIRSAQPEALDELLRVSAPRERGFLAAFLVLSLLLLVAWAALAV